MEKYAVLNLKSTKFVTSNEYRVVEVIDSETFKSLENCQNGAITKKENKRFNWVMTGFKTEKEARKWLANYKHNKAQK